MSPVPLTIRYLSDKIDANFTFIIIQSTGMRVILMIYGYISDVIMILGKCYNHSHCAAPT